METKCWNVATQPQAITEAATLIREGSIVAFPTETVYGLGADALKEQAVNKIFRAKNRPQDNPLIVHVSAKDQLKTFITELPGYAERLIDEFTPGPITFVLKGNGKCASNVTAGLSTIAIRIPSHPIALKFLKECNLPVAAPSANISGRPSPTSAEHVLEDLGGQISGILNGGTTDVGMESTVIDCTGKIPVILRPGGITTEQIEEVVGKVHLMEESKRPRNIQSPGMKYKHYTPEVPLWIVEGPPEHLQQVIEAQAHLNHLSVLATNDTIKEIQADHLIPLGDNLHEIAANLYDLLRKFKANETDLIICESLPKTGIGQAIMNRLEKAADQYIQWND